MLKKVILQLEEDILQQKLLCGESMLLDDLREHGVELVIGHRQGAIGDIGAGEGSEAEDSDVACNSTGYGAECVEREEMDAVCESTEDSIEELLYITDSEEAYRGLCRQGKYVLPYRHEGNREAGFAGAMYVIEEMEEADYETVDLVYRRFVGLPWEILRTSRCIIRETTEADVDSFYDIYMEPEITRYMEDLYEDREEELAYVAEYREKVYGFYGYGMRTVLKRDGTVIGRAGISWREGYELPELGFVIGVPWQRQGYACEVCRAILDYARKELGFTHVQALVMEGNEQSAALCRKLGFRRTGTVAEDGGSYAVYEWERGENLL